MTCYDVPDISERGGYGSERGQIAAERGHFPAFSPEKDPFGRGFPGDF